MKFYSAEPGLASAAEREAGRWSRRAQARNFAAAILLQLVDAIFDHREALVELRDHARVRVLVPFEF